jgi:dihydrofolate reductase
VRSRPGIGWKSFWRQLDRSDEKGGADEQGYFSKFDIANAWGGNPPGGGSCFVVTHTVPQEWVKDGSPFTFVTDGVESAIRQAKKAAGGKDVGVSSASIAQQCLQAGLLDEIQLDLAPVLLGGGVRLFDRLGAQPIQLETIKVVNTPDVTHLRFRVVKQ